MYYINSVLFPNYILLGKTESIVKWIKKKKRNKQKVNAKNTPNGCLWAHYFGNKIKI